ncbi:MAG: DUF4011 domain-containing protein [Arachnia sp.]
MSQVAITAVVTPIISHAMAHTGISPVRQLEVANSGVAREAAELSVSVSDSQGVLSRPWTRLLDLAAESSIVLDDISLRLLPERMEQVEEQRPGTVHIAVVHDGEQIGHLTEDVSILAGSQWLAVPPGLAEELLAVHVMPNAPQITALMPRVAELVKAESGRSGLDGYQSDEPERVDMLAAAVFGALQEKEINYAEPPASWADIGQKVRTPAAVIDGRLGTCLDTCVVMAAALEQVGLHPQVWILRGHAVLGYWRTEVESSASVTYDASELVNFIDLGYLAIVETTMITTKDASFGRARAAGTQTVQRNPDDVMRVLDIYAARRSRITPLPAIERENGVVRVVEYRPAEHSVAPTEQTREVPSPHAQREARPMPPRVQQWKNALLDLGLRNRLINFTARSAVHLYVDDDSLRVLEDHLNAHRVVGLRPADDIPDALKAQYGRTAADLPDQFLSRTYADQRSVYTDISSAAYLGRLRSLAHKARTIQEETGANNLYLALGSLVWELDGRALRSPLVLVPLVLQAGRRGGIYQMTGDEAGQSTPNYCLLERLRQSFGLAVPGLENPVLDASGIDLAAAFGAMRKALVEKGLPFRVEETADIAILQFAKYRLWKDIDEGWEQLIQAPLVKHLALSPTDEFVDPVPGKQQPDLEELATECPIPADGSQLVAVAEALAGRTFVLEGPPGTGKSQTIANLLARAIATGKKVLFVAEKRAALNVVSGRVDEVGLGAFTLDLHDKLSKPAMVRRQIAHALDLTTRGDAEGLRACTEVSRSAGGVLDRYARRLHEPNAAGLSMYSAETQRLVLGEASEPELEVPEHLVQPGNEGLISELRQLVRLLPEVADPAFPSPDAPWGFVGAEGTEAIDFAAVASAVRAIEDIARNTTSATPFERAVLAVRRVEEVRLLQRLIHARLPLALLDEVRTERWRSAIEAVEAAVEQFHTGAAPALKPALPSILDFPLEDLLARAQAAAQSSFWGRKKRQLAVIDEFRSAIAGVGVERKEAVAHLTRWLQVQQHMRGLVAQANAIPGISLPVEWNLFTGVSGENLTQQQAGRLQELATGVDPASNAAGFTAALRELLAEQQGTDKRSIDRLDAFASALGDLPELLGTTADCLERWSGIEGFLPRWLVTSSGREPLDPQLRSLARWLALRSHLAPLARCGMEEAHRQLLTGEVVSHAASMALERGLTAASRAERSRSQGLGAFDAVSHQRAVQRFVEASTEARTALRGTLAEQAIARRTFSGESTSGQVGRLKRELNRQRGGLSVRELMAQFGGLITEIMPCVLVSPDSVARFLPLGAQVFDIVVFDEASQIRVADAIGAIGRARSVIVVGDSKQMPPTSFAEANWRADGEEDDGGLEGVVDDEESILSECVQARVRREWLTWHYRSQDEALIAFSNAHYYDGKLSSFPSPAVGRSDRSADGHGISLVRVDGEFLRSSGGKLKRTNPVEARAVVEEIQRRFAHAEDGTIPSIGVVTFNQQQRAYIEALIRDTGDECLVEALDSPAGNGLFVKNLENVQGDERDVIFFSTAFSVNERGVLPLNFGPLNRIGGERRLNVAITRARRQVIVFSSFDPAYLRAEETSSVGIKHLRGYLDVAALGTAMLERAATRTVNIDRHREEMADALRARGLVVSTDVGLSDFRVDLQLASPSNPARPLVAVLLDGPLWAKRRTVGDRDGMPSEVLHKAMRWPVVERVWLPEWLHGREAVLDRLEEAATKAAVPTDNRQAAPGPDKVPTIVVRARRSIIEEIDDPGRSTPPENGASDSQVAVASAFRAAPAASAEPTLTASTQAQAFVPWEPGRVGSVDVLDALEVRSSASVRATQQVRGVLIAGIRHEGPIHVDRLVKLTAGAFGLSRVAATRAAAIQRAAAARTDASGFYWAPEVDPHEWLSYRPDPAGQRPIDHISEIELANAMRDLCIDAHGMGDDELRTEVLRVFGMKRRTPKAVQSLDRALSIGLVWGRLVRDGEDLLFGA